VSSCTENEQKGRETKSVVEQSVNEVSESGVDEQMVDDVVGGLLDDTK